MEKVFLPVEQIYDLRGQSPLNTETYPLDWLCLRLLVYFKGSDPFMFAKYRGPGGSYPSSVPASKLSSWTNEARAAANAMPDGALKNQVLNALDNGRVDAQIFKWPR